MHNTKLLLSILSIILFVLIMFWINYLVYNNYIIKNNIEKVSLENFDNSVVSSVFLDDSSKYSETLLLDINKRNHVPNVYLGKDIWSAKFFESQQIFDKRYKPTNMIFEPNYNSNYTTTGLFKYSGPLPSNYKI